jgi:hypothetical protein
MFKESGNTRSYTQTSMLESPDSPMCKLFFAVLQAFAFIIYLVDSRRFTALFYDHVVEVRALIVAPYLTHRS